MIQLIHEYDNYLLPIFFETHEIHLMHVTINLLIKRDLTEKKITLIKIFFETTTFK